jgi:hypothetical protein
MSYVPRTGTKRNIAEIAAAGWGWLVGPLDMGGPIRAGLRHACDNGAWPANQAFLRGDRANSDPDLKRFMAMLERHGPSADFIIIPDVVMGGERSWVLTKAWMRRLRRMPRLRAARLLIAVQDGFSPEMIRPYLNERIGIFVGGSTDWKLATLSVWGALAKDCGAYVHCGRVNTAKRIALCGKAGMDSYDGLSGAMYAATVRPLERARYSAVLDRSQIDIEDFLRRTAA